MSYSMEIKNLSIALEALSRIQGLNAMSREVERLLNKAITRMKEEDPDIPVHSRPPKVPYTATAPLDDDIPF